MFPEKPTCHGPDRQWRPAPPAAPLINPETYHPQPIGPRGPYTDDAPFRSCSYCGSIHPEDLVRHLAAGATLRGSDWKYGWPHKFYVEIPNPEPDKVYCVGHGSGGGKPDEFYFGKRPVLHAKWYNDHLLDEGFAPEKLLELIAAIEKHAGIRFEIESGRLGYRAPHHGYQR